MTVSIALAQRAIALLQRADSLHSDVRAPGDTMTVFHPPREITAVERVIRFFFSVPQWLQLAGAALAIVLGLVALVLVWRNRGPLLDFARRRHLTTPMRWKVGLGIVAILVVAVLALSGAAFFTYSQQNNQFCLSCHTLHDEVFERFQQSKHHTVANLRCHDCHDEPLLAETKQILFWMTRRPTEVGPHAPVPRTVCATCHIKTDADSSWKRIVATAGHSIHVLSDTAKKLHIECLTCHGVTAHRFVPVGQTCAKSGCHDRTKFQLGKMAGQSAMHCTVCHNFTAPVNEHIALDSAKRALIPTTANCLTCHRMQTRMAAFVPAHDPHKGRCGDCHDPHKQTSPEAAWKTCTNSGCHARPDTLTSFHRGIAAPVLANCASCHKAHDWKVKGDACLTCHKNIYSDHPTSSRTALATPASTLPPMPAFSFARFVGGVRHAAARVVPPAVSQQSQQYGSEPFQHSRHRGLACTACHSTTGAKHGALTVRTKTDCLTCHHGAEPRAGAGPIACAHCHTSAELARAPRQQTIIMRMTVTSTPKSRTLPFTHTLHASLNCVDCHSTPVTRAVARDCTTCHADHHTATRNCVLCHAGAKKVHKRQDVHQGCAGSGCHQDKAALALTATRNVCLTCHNDKVNHKAGGECAKCHQVRWTPTAVRRIAAN